MYEYNGQYHEWNDENYGLGIGYELSDHIEARAGFFDNSFHKTSTYAGINWHTSRERLLSVGLMAGLVGGYQDTPSSNGGFVLPNVALNWEQITGEFGYQPRLHSHQSNVITFSIGVLF